MAVSENSPKLQGPQKKPDGHGAAIATVGTPRAENIWSGGQSVGLPSRWGFPTRARIPRAPLSCAIGCWCILNAAARRSTSSASRPLHFVPWGHYQTCSMPRTSHWVRAQKPRSCTTCIWRCRHLQKCRLKMMGGKCGLPDCSRSGKPRADLIRDRWIQSPEC
jgi:hypothetical protein